MTELLAASTKFIRDEEGASLVEYGLLLTLVAVVCIGIVGHHLALAATAGVIGFRPMPDESRLAWLRVRIVTSPSSIMTFCAAAV